MVHVVSALLQLSALAGFGVGVAWLNAQAPRHVSQRVFKLSWLLPTVAVGIVVCWLLSTSFINVPHLLQHTNPSLVESHNAIRAECATYLGNLQFDTAYTTISRRTKTAELVGEAKKAAAAAGSQKTSIAKSLSPVFNFVLFHTGVTVVFVPALLRLLLLLWKIRQRAAAASSGGAGAEDARKKARFDESVRREWGVLLPVMNAVTVVSLCVSPSFYFFIEPGRAHRCMYTSGHWFTFTCTLLTFAFVLTHLYRNREYCKSTMKLLTWYFAFLIVYLAAAIMVRHKQKHNHRHAKPLNLRTQMHPLALSDSCRFSLCWLLLVLLPSQVLKTTQTFFHDSLEARDGIRQALPAFVVFVCILIGFQFLTRTKRDVTDTTATATVTKRTKQPAAVAQEEEEEEEEAEDGTAAAASKPSSGKKKAAVRKFSSDAGSAGADEDAAAEEAAAASSRRSSSRKKKAADAEVADSAAAASSSSSSSAAAAVPDAPPQAPPMAPPMAPPLAPAAAPKVSKPAAPKLKPAAPAASGGDRDALLADIASGAAKRLRHVSKKDEADKPAAKPVGELSALARAMQNIRVAVDGEVDEGPEDEWVEL
jgi:amino acid transporter